MVVLIPFAIKRKIIASFRYANEQKGCLGEATLNVESFASTVSGDGDRFASEEEKKCHAQLVLIC